MGKEHILIIRFSAMGDVAMTVPVVYSLAKQYPDVRITMLSKGFARPFFDGLAPNIEFVAADLKGCHKGIKGLNRLFKELTSKDITAVADMHDVLRSKYLRARFKLCRYKTAHIDKHRKGKRQLTAAENKRLVQQPSSFNNYAEVLDKLGYPVHTEFTSVFPSGRGDITLLPDYLQSKQPKEQWIGIAPFAAHEGKIYPTRLMERVVKLLLERHENCRIFLFGGGASEKAVFNDWCQRYERCVSVPDSVKGMKQEMILMSHLDVMTSMDSGNMHIASLTGTPVVSIWGATHPFAGFMGWGQSIANAVQIDLPCRPCSIYGNKPCIRKDYPCMKNIPPELIVERIEAVLNSI
ncbi:MAG: glycosyltransferase family 9 protein [Prevotella sp.]|nr:glycosyltransferase family 9 protein [Prevotella sp.]